MGDSLERRAFTRQGRRPTGAHNPGLPGSTPGPGNRQYERKVRVARGLETVMRSCAFLGIDPGLSGYISLYNPSQNRLEVFKMPKQISEIMFLIGKLDSIDDSVDDYSCIEMAVLEKVQGYIGNSHPGSAMFRFGENFGALEASLCFLSIPHQILPPRKWRKILNIPEKCKNQSDSQYKAFLVETCGNLLPKHRNKITKANVDSILLALVAQKIS